MVDFKTEGFGLGLKLENLIIMENVLLVLYLLVGYSTLPQWFKFLENIKFNYVVAILNLGKMEKIKNNENENEKQSKKSK